jgi:hypothetical protein
LDGSHWWHFYIVDDLPVHNAPIPKIMVLQTPAEPAARLGSTVAMLFDAE